METSNMVESYDICTVCEAKYGSWDRIKQKLKELKVLNEDVEQAKTDIEPFNANVTYSGGTKQDVLI